MSNQVTCLLLELAGLEFQVRNSRHTSAGPGYAGHGKWGVYAAVETCALHRLDVPRPPLQWLHLGGTAVTWRKEILISVHCNTSFIHSNSMFPQQLLTEAYSHGWKSPSTLVFHFQRPLWIRSRKLLTVTPCCSKGNQTTLGPILYTKRLSAQSSCETYLPKRSVSRVRNDALSTQ